MLGSYLNQGAKLERAAGTDDRGQATFGPALAVRCRKQRRGRLALTSQDATRLQETVYYLMTPVSEGDKLDGLVVKTVNDWVGLNGGQTGYKAVV